jgi:hypothetical protein
MLKALEIKKSRNLFLYIFLTVLLLTGFCVDLSEKKSPQTNPKQVSGEQAGFSMPNPVNYSYWYLAGAKGIF